MVHATFLLLLAAFCTVSNGDYYSDQYEVVKKRLAPGENGRQGTPLTWEHGKNAYFEGMTEDEIKMRVHGLLVERKFDPREKNNKLKNNKAIAVHNIEDTEIEDEFDSREKWPKCKYIGLIKDQSRCGSCWAVSSASVMSDRICIKHDQKFSPYISEEDILSCCQYCGDGCNGGFPIRAFKYWTIQGVPTGGIYGSEMGCKPYSIEPGRKTEATTPACSNGCTGKHHRAIEKDRYYGTQYFFADDEKTIQREIMKNGPIVVGFAVYRDFIYYKKGVYRHSPSERFLGYHAVKLIGWGVDYDSGPYWLVVNSWNTTFGENGLFKIARGTDECGIESFSPAAGYAV